MSSIVGQNITTTGRTIFIRSNPAVGVVALTAFTDDNNSPQSGFSFSKSFRYSTNGVLFSQWAPLTIPNILAIAPDPDKAFVFEVQYNSPEPAGLAGLTVTETTLTATTQANPVTPFFANSLFAKYFDAYDQEVINWYVNVLQKLWEKGLLANYLERDVNDPTDFLDFWTGVMKLFAYYVKLARVFSTFYNNPTLLADFLQQRGLNTSIEDSLDDLRTMLQTFYFQMARRGTQGIVDEEEVNAPINGEMRRLIYYQSVDEFLFNAYLPQNFGWCLGRCSPLYKGLRVNDSLNKAPWSPGYTSMDNAGDFLTGDATIQDRVANVGFDNFYWYYGEGLGEENFEDIVAGESGDDIDQSVLVVTSSGGINANVKVDPNLDYEFSFQILLSTGTEVTFNIGGLDINNNSINLLNRSTLSPTTTMIGGAKLSRSDLYVTVRCYLYNYQRGQFAEDTTSIKQGNNVIAGSAELQNVTFSVSTNGPAKIFDFKMMPVQTDYSRGFVQANHFISAWLKNRNKIYTIKQLENYITHYLIPYNSHIKLTNLGDYLYTTMEEDIDSTFWIGAGQYCRTVSWIPIDPSCEVANLIWIPEDPTSYCQQDDGSIPPTPPGLTLDFTYDDLANAPVADPTSVADWNTFLSTTFTTISVTGQTVHLSGDPDVLFSTPSLFANDTHLLAVADNANCVVSIAGAVFLGCTALQSVSFPRAVLIDSASQVFKNCTSLTTVFIPMTTVIPDSAFNTCTSLTTVSFPNVTVLHNSAFGESGVVNVSLPLAQIIGNGAFVECNSLITISLPAATDMSTGEQFADCLNLQNVDIPLVSNLGAGAFVNCTDLATLNAPSVATIGANCFTDSPALANFHFPNCVTVANQAFSGCTGMTAIDLSVCTNLGPTTGNDHCFDFIVGKTIAFKIKTATATDGDVVALQSINTVTLTLV